MLAVVGLLLGGIVGGPLGCAAPADRPPAARPEPEAAVVRTLAAAAESAAVGTRAAPPDGPGPGAPDPARAATLADLAAAADRAGDAPLAAEYRRQAVALGMPAVATAPAAAGSGEGVRAARPAAAARGRAAPAARRAPPGRRAPGAVRRPPPPRRPAARRPAPAGNALDRVFARAERWLSGGPGVVRRSP